MFRWRTSEQRLHGLNVSSASKNHCLNEKCGDDQRSVIPTEPEANATAQWRNLLFAMANGLPRSYYCPKISGSPFLLFPITTNFE